MRAAENGWHRDWSAAGRVVCVRLDGMGDVLMMTPAIRALTSSAPDRRITLLASPSGAPIAPLIPEINDVIVYSAPWTKEGERDADPAQDAALIERLRGAFEAAVIFTTYTQSALPAALMCRLAGVPLRLAYARENPYALLTHRLPDSEPESGIRHEVRRQLDLVAAIGCVGVDESLSLRVPVHARDSVRALLSGHGVEPGRPWALFHPGATAPSRRYPPQRLAQAADIMASHAGVQVVISGAPADTPLADEMLQAMRSRAVSVAGATDVEELAALVEAAPVVVTANSVPSHMAAALGTPAVVLYALTNPQHTPWTPPHLRRVLSHDVPCRNCLASVCREPHHGCLEYVTPDEIAAAALSLMSQKVTGPTKAPIASP